MKWQQEADPLPLKELCPAYLTDSLVVSEVSTHFSQSEIALFSVSHIIECQIGMK